MVYNKIIHNKSIENLTLYGKCMICHYIMMQNEHTRSARIRNAQMTEFLYKNGGHELNLPPYESLDDEYKKRFLESRGATAQINIMFNSIEMENGTIHNPLKIIFKIVELDWTLLKNDLKREFYTSDHLVFVYNSPIKANEMIRGFGMESYSAEGVEIFFPLTPRLCLLLYDKEKSEYKNCGLERLVNQGELDWINTQVIAMAHRTVFTKNNDFQFIRKCIKEYPELKDTNRSRL